MDMLMDLVLYVAINKPSPEAHEVIPASLLRHSRPNSNRTVRVTDRGG